MKVSLKAKDFGEFLVSRPAGREAALSAKAYNDGLRALLESPATDEKICHLDFFGVTMIAPSWLEEFLRHLRESGVSSFEFSNPEKNPTVDASLDAIDPELLSPPMPKR